MSEKKQTETVREKKDEDLSLSELIRKEAQGYRERYERYHDCRNCNGKCLHKNVGFMIICTSTYINGMNKAYIGKYVDECPPLR